MLRTTSTHFQSLLAKSLATLATMALLFVAAGHSHANQAQARDAAQEPIINYRERFLPVVAQNGMIVSPERLAADLPDNASVYIVPAFTGLGAPHWDANARGTVTGLTRAASARRRGCGR